MRSASGFSCFQEIGDAKIRDAKIIQKFYSSKFFLKFFGKHNFDSLQARTQLINFANNK